MIRRLGSAVLAAGIALAGLTAGTASAAPGGCADYHWIGAAGSGQRDAAGLTANGGMGSVVYQSYQQLKSAARRRRPHHRRRSCPIPGGRGATRGRDQRLAGLPRQRR